MVMISGTLQTLYDAQQVRRHSNQRGDRNMLRYAYEMYTNRLYGN